MRVIHFEREAIESAFSIERLFAAVRAALPAECEVEVVRCPSPHHGRLWLAKGLIRAWRNRAMVQHVCGDVQYLALALPGETTIMTVHDLNALENATGIRRFLLEWIYWILPLRKCGTITCISEATRQILIRRYPWLSSKVTVIPNCVPAGFTPEPKIFNTRQPRVLQIGTLRHKNLERVAAAVSDQGCVFVTVGELTEKQRTLLRNLRIEHEELVGLSDLDLRRAYVECDLVVFASLYEGFGLPIIEANAIGRPVITSNTAPMNAVAGSAACLIDPFSVDSIRRGIQRVIHDAQYRASLIERGYENAAKYGADKIAQKFFELYRAVSDKGGRHG